MNKRLVAGIVAGLGMLALAAMLVLAVLYFGGPTHGGEPPPRGAAPSSPPSSRSTVALPIDIPMASLHNDIAAKIPDVFLNERQQVDNAPVVIDVIAERDGDVVVKGVNGRLVVILPIKVTAGGTTKGRAGRKAKRGKDMPHDVVVTAPLRIRVALTMAITEEWGLKATSKIRHSWSSDPKLKVGPFSFKITKKVDALIEKKYPEIQAIVEERIAASPKVRDKVEASWAKLAKPRKNEGEPPSWMVIDAREMFASDPEVKADGLHLTAGIRGRMALVIGDKPTVRERPLPPRTRPPKKTGMSLHLPISVPWTLLEEKATEAVVGKTYSTTGADITADAVTVYPSGEHIVVGVDYHAATAALNDEGTLYLKGRAEVTDDVLKVVDVDYVLSTTSMLSSADSIAHSGIVAALQDHVEMPLADELKKARRKANKALRKAKMDDGGTLEGSVDRIQVLGVRPTDEAVVVDTKVTGELRLRTK